jgi:DNA-binding CsgD family transcriptional regulator
VSDFRLGRAWPLTGRDEELSLIAACLSQPAGATGVAIFGPAGVGKSRLLAEAAKVAVDDGTDVRWIVANASARTIPLGAFLDWTSRATGGPLELVGCVVHALTETSEGRRVVVAVDDAHLLDDLSSFVLHQLVVQKAATVIISVRTGEPVPDAVTALWKDHHLQRLDLQPLSQTEATTLLGLGLGGSVDPDIEKRMWALTQGNVLFLRHLVDQELRHNRLKSLNGRWVWSGAPIVSPRLMDLIESQVGSVSDAVRDVVDLVAVSEPLDTAVLSGLVSAEAMEEAEQRGLIVVSATRGRAVARIGHPLYGEARRSNASPLRLRRLRGLVAQAICKLEEPGDPVRLGLLWMESDLEPNAQLLFRAAEAAFMRLDLALTDQLADASVAAGGGAEPAILRVHALQHMNRVQDCEDLLNSVDPSAFDDREFANFLTIRAANLLWPLASPDDAWTFLHSIKTTKAVVQQSLQAFQGLQLAMAARPHEAIAAAESLDPDALPDLAALVVAWGLTIALGDVGRTAEAVAAATRGLDRAARSHDAPFQATTLTDLYLTALLLTGRLHDAGSFVEDVLRRWGDAPGLTAVAANAYAASVALRQGHLDVARRVLEPAMSVFVAVGEDWTMCDRFTHVYVELLGRLGDVAAATAARPTLERRRHPSSDWLQSDRLLAASWVSATQGAVRPAIDTARQAAAYAREHGQFAREVLCLQTATQFGDKQTAARLAELTDLVEGPRVTVAAAFAAALAEGDAPAMEAVSAELEEMGDLLAAADAAAHAAIAYRTKDRRGAALTADSRAQQLAQRCGGAVSPALREAAQPIQLTAREREIISLVAQGLTNRQIAEKLTMSIRTVEGHLYRASRRLGINREALGKLMCD